MKRLSILLVLVAVAWGTFSYADFAGTGFSGPPFTHGTLTDTKYCIYTAGAGIVCNSDGGGESTTALPWDNITSRPTINSVTVTGAVLDNASNYPTTLNSKGGTGQNSSASTGVPYVLSGTWSFDNVATFMARIWSGSGAYLKYDGTRGDPAGAGDVTGGSTSVDGELAAYNSTGGKTVKQSFFKLSGPASSVKTYTLPNVNATIYTDNNFVAGTNYQAVLGFTAENSGNKSDNVSLGSSATLYPTQNAVKSYADTGLALKAPIASPTFTGTLTVAAGTDGSRGLFLNSNTTATCAAGDNGVKFVGGVMFFCYNGTLKSPLDNSSSPATIGAAATNQTMNIGTTAVAINRASAALVLTGITSIDGSAATATTAGNLSGTPAVPNGTTATTQSPNDNTGKIATNAYVDQRYEYERVVIDQPALSDNIIIAGPLDRAWTIDNVVVVIQDNTGKLSTAATDNVTFNVQYGATSAFGSPTNVFTSNVVATGAVDYSAALNNTAPLTNYYIRVVFSVVNMTNKKFYIRIKYHRT